MAVTVKVNGSSNSIVHKGSTGIAKCTAPDVCKTPSPGGPVPIPYPVIVSMSSDLANGSTTVKADGNMIGIKGCEFSMCTGDEAGTAGGVVSSTFKKEAKFILYSFDVKVDGKNTCRLGDKMTMNHQNTFCLGGVVQFPVEVTGLEAQLRELARRCNETVNKERKKKKPPKGKECTKLGVEKHKCCEKAINKHMKDKGPPPDIRSEVPYNSKGQLLTNAAGNPNAVAKGAVTRFVNQHAPSGAPSAVGRARSLAKRLGVWKKAFFRAGRGTGFRADVLIVEPDGASPVPPNIKKSFDFKFSCKENEEISESQKAKYRQATGTEPKPIHIDGRIM